MVKGNDHLNEKVKAIICFFLTAGNLEKRTKVSSTSLKEEKKETVPEPSRLRLQQ